MQSRRSLLIWKVFGERLDGWNNDDLPYETIPGDPKSLRHKGKPVADTPQNREHRPHRLHRQRHAAAGSRGRHLCRTGRQEDQGRAADRRGPADARALDRPRLPDRPGLRRRPSRSSAAAAGCCDDNRPTLTLTYPRAGNNESLTRILVGMHDYDTGLDMDSFQVVADFAIDGIAAGKNLAKKFRPVSHRTCGS